MTKIPATRSPVGELTRGTRVLENATREVNTSANPSTKSSIGTRGRSRAPATSPETACPPEMNETYPGRSGNTHGEAHETTPAANASPGAHHAWSAPLTSTRKSL